MDLEEHTIEELPARCEECGTELTEEELTEVLESGAPALCSVHAAEATALDGADDGDELEA